MRLRDRRVRMLCVLVILAGASVIADGQAGRDPLISQARTWQRHNVGDTPGFGGDHERALRSIARPVLSMPCQTDFYFPIGDFEHERQFIRDVTFAPIPSLGGHMAGGGGGTDGMFIDEQIRQFVFRP